MPALIFDLDGTLVDSVYEHAIAWRRALAAHGIDLPVFEIHKRIGMTGPAMLDALAEAYGFTLDEPARKGMEKAHSMVYKALREGVTAAPGVRALWRALEQRGLKWAIATSAEADEAEFLLKVIDAPESTAIVTQQESDESKPSPDSFERAAQKIGEELRGSFVIGDSVWDMLAARRCGAFGVGVLTGGYGEAELTAAGAYRVYRDVGELSRRLSELGV